MSWVYRTEVRRSPLRWVLPVLIAVDLLGVFGRSTSWIGVWPEAGAAAQIPAFYLGPAMAGAAAWAAARRRRANAGGWMDAAARPVPGMELAHFAATLTYGVAAYVTGVVAAAAVTVPQGGPHFWWPGYVLLGLAVITMCTALGHLLGRASTSLVALPVFCALAVFVVLGLFGPVPQGTEWGWGLSVLSGYPDVVVGAGPLAARVGVAVALVAVAVTAGRRLRSSAGVPGWPSVPVAGLGAVTALAVCVVLTGLASPLLERREPPGEPLCTVGEPRVCLWPEHQRYLAQAEEMSRRIAALPQDLLTSPPVFHETGLHGEEEMGEGFYLMEGEIWTVATSLAIRIEEASSPPYCDATTPEADEARFQASMEVIAWLTARIAGGGKPSTLHGGPPGVDEEAVHALTGEPESTQRAWVRERLDIVRGTPCV